MSGRVFTPIVHLVLQMAGALGVDRSHLLAVAGLTERDLIDRDGYVDLAKQVAIGKELCRLRPDRNIGLAALEYMRPGNLGVLGYVLQHSPTLGSALRAFARYQTLLSDAVTWRVTTGDSEPGPAAGSSVPSSGADGLGAGDATVTVECAEALQELGFPLETQVGSWVLIGRVLTGVTWVPRWLSLRHRPRGDVTEFHRFFQCPVSFGAATNQLVIPAEALALPVVGAQQALRPSFMRLVETRLEALRGPERRGDTSERVRALLIERISSGLTGRDQAARQLGMSQRTLSRRLRAEGTTFREILEEVRRELAEAWLDDPENAIYEVAYLLGYSEPSTFHRSFRRWTGHTPDAWRQERAGV